jgi:hypothetical protein
MAGSHAVIRVGRLSLLATAGLDEWLSPSLTRTEPGLQTIWSTIYYIQGCLARDQLNSSH